MATRTFSSRTKHSLVGLFDVHIPEHDSAAWKAALSFVRDTKPTEIVLGGDFLELASCSSHGGDPDPMMLVDEIAAGRVALDQIQRASPKSRIVYMAGNHENRLDRHITANARTLYGALSLQEMLGLRERGITWVPYGQQVRRGKLIIIHGSFTPKHHAAKHLETYGHSVAYGHTHRPQTFSRATATSPIQASFGVGCLRTLDAAWLHGVPVGWAHGLLYAEFFGDGLYTAHNIIMADRRFAFSGRVYG